MTCMFAIDPSTTVTGWACIHGNKIKGKGAIKPDPSLSWTSRVLRTMEILEDTILMYEPTSVIIELPETYHAGGGKGAKAASSGSVGKLSFAAGAYSALSREYVGYNVILVTPSVWKGQLPKSVTFDRMKEKYPFDLIHLKKNEYDFNITDAVGLADYGLKGAV